MAERPARAPRRNGGGPARPSRASLFRTPSATNHFRFFVMESFAPRKLWQPILVAAAVLFVYWSVLRRLVGFWWEDENYSHGLLVPFIIGYILWTERARLARL